MTAFKIVCMSDYVLVTAYEHVLFLKNLFLRETHTHRGREKKEVKFIMKLSKILS